MLTKNHVLPIGSVIAVRFNSDEGKHTIAVIIGHLTLRRDMVSRYDYTCVEYPCGVENGLFYVNQEDIIDVIHRTPDHDNLHMDWMEVKYAEYLAYYRHYDPDGRPDIDSLRQSIRKERDSLRKKLRQDFIEPNSTDNRTERRISCCPFKNMDSRVRRCFICRCRISTS